MAELTCPFCGYKSESEYSIMYHLESHHSEGESPFISNYSQHPHQLSEGHPVVDPAHENLQLVGCSREGCGEFILLTELETHMLMHEIDIHDGEMDVSCLDTSLNKSGRNVGSESESIFDTRLPPTLRNLETRDVRLPEHKSAGQVSVKAGWRERFNMPGSRHKTSVTPDSGKPHRRLGRSQLGPYAHEEQMPIWLRHLLETDGKTRAVSEPSRLGRPSKPTTIENHISGVLSVVEKLINKDSKTQYAYTCHPCVQHVFKLKNEGGFCGYRNIQMLTSYIIGVNSEGFHHFDGKLPSIFQIQDFIENAWDAGINSQGRLETGGIRGTRKYIGTPEAQAMLVSLGIACSAQGLKTTDHVRADQLLLQYVEEYFSSECTNLDDKVRSTTLGPLYLQHPGHSMTIVGFEKKVDGNVNLLVFDPMFHDSIDIVKLIGQDVNVKNSPNYLRAYRRSVNYLRKYKEFEVLKLTIPKIPPTYSGA